MKLYSRRHPLLINLFTVPVAAICIAILGFYFALTTPPVSLSKLRRLHDRMTTTEVLAILGTPSRVIQSEGEETWVYQKFYCLQAIEVRFGDGGFSMWHWE